MHCHLLGAFSAYGCSTMLSCLVLSSWLQLCPPLLRHSCTVAPCICVSNSWLCIWSVHKYMVGLSMDEFLFSKLSYFYLTLQFLLDWYEFWLYFVFHRNLNLVVQNIKYLLFDVLKRVQFYLKKHLYSVSMISKTKPEVCCHFLCLDTCMPVMSVPNVSIL